MVKGWGNLPLIIVLILLAFGFSRGEEGAYLGDLGVIVITPTRLEQQLREVPLATVVVTQEEIRALKAKNAAELLETINGAEVKNYGWTGTSAAISIRGSLANRVLVLLDGRPLNAISTGETDLAQISAEQVERIEIVKGPTSHLYGANALGGVVNIITKDAPETVVASAEISYEDFNTQAYKLENGSSFGRMKYLVTASKKTSDGSRKNSDYDGNDIMGKLTYDLGEPGSKVTLSFFYHADELGLPGPLPKEGTKATYGDESVTSLYDRQRDRNFVYDILFRYALAENSKLSFRTYFDSREMKFHSVNDNWTWPEKGTEDDTYTTDIIGAGINYELNWLDTASVLLGIDAHHDRFSASLNILNDATGELIVTKWSPKTDACALWIQNKLAVATPITATLGVRYDHHSAYGQHISPNLGIVYAMNKKSRIRASIGRAFRAPTFNDLYWPQGGNPDLRPETGWQAEIGKESEITANSFVRTALFYREIRDMIAWTPDRSGLWKPSNVNRNNTWGMEIELMSKLTGKLSANIGYTFLDSRQRRKEVVYDDFAGNVVLEEKVRKAAFVPTNKVDLRLTYQNRSKFRLQIEGNFIDKIVNYYPDYTKFPEVTMSTKKLKEHFVLHARISKHIFRDLEVFLACHNLLNAEYMEQFGTAFDDRGYPMPGRTIMGGLSWKLGL